MRSSTRSLLVSFGAAAAILVTPLALQSSQQVVHDIPAAVAAEAATESPDAVLADRVPESPSAVVPGSVIPAPIGVPAPSAPGTAVPGSATGDGLPPELLPAPPYPQCPVTEAGAWWTDPADPYTCIPPGSIPFHEPTPPGIDPELLKPIFEEPGAGDDCRTTGALQCAVTIMGQEYVVTFANGKPVSVSEAQG